VDLGHDPPLMVDGGDGVVVRRRVSVKWLSGTVLTGLCGATLMGGAVFATFDGQTNFAAVPERLEAALRGTLAGLNDRLAAAPRKTDRLPTIADINAARQVLRISTAVKVGDHEVVRVRPLIRVVSNLALSTSDLSASVPAFNPQKLLADVASPGPAGAEPPEAEPDAEVSFVTRDLGSVLPKAKLAALLPMDEILSRVRDVAEWATGSTRTALDPGLHTGMRLAYAAEGTLDPYVGFEARIVPENITLLAKTATQNTGGNTWNERTVTAKKGDTVGSILREFNAAPEEIKAILAVFGARGRDGGIKEGQKLRILLSPAEAGQRLQPIRVMVQGDGGIEAAVALSDAGKYVSVDVQHVDNEIAEAEEDDNDAGAVRLYQSLYETALRNQIPKVVINDLIRIYSYDVDFQRRVQPGDTFDVLFSDDETGEGKNEVLYTTLTIGGETKQYFRFQAPDDNAVDYYDESGKSAKKFLVRKPVIDGMMRSGFGVRRHPILGYLKMHTGVDWAAPNGTPIYAAGQGTVEKAGWESGYGKYVRIRHANGYQTAYGHMSGFARGIRAGVRVHQGQIIGYVGSTGLSTGAHLHYEIMVNNRFVDPMRIKLPRGRVLQGPVLAGFERERDRVTGILSRAPQLARR
jgi:murein DD-endopeptidase MepM/ murein hydrolase activator NlpD